MEKIKRKPNWSSDELDALAQSVRENINIIKGKFSPGLTNLQKNKCWEVVADRVNSVNTSGVIREVFECKKKWQDLASITKKKEANRRKSRNATGGGPLELHETKSWEEVIIGTLSNSSVEGVTGGVDTSESYDANDNSVQSIPYTGEDITDNTSANTPVESESSIEAVQSTNMSTGQEHDFLTKKKKKNNFDMGITSNRLIGIEEEKLKISRENLRLKQQKMALMEEMLSLQKRCTEGVETIAMIMKNQEITGTFFEQ